MLMKNEVCTSVYFGVSCAQLTLSEASQPVLMIITTDTQWFVRCQESQTTSTIRHNIIKYKCELADDWYELHLSVNGTKIRRFREAGKYAGPRCYFLTKSHSSL